MDKLCKWFPLIMLGTLLGAPAILAQNAPPQIFFSDLESGPNNGGQNGKGAFATLYGRGFGAARGASTVTVGGGAVDNCPLWTDTKVACQLGLAARTGNIVVTVAGQASNGVPFTVRPGNIYFVSPAGSDTNPGTFTAPFQTPVKGKDTLAPGDILYLMDGINTSVIDDFGAVLNLRSSGAPGLPKAIVAYPGASVTLGSDATPQRAILAPDVVGKPWTDWVIAGLTLRANDAALEMVGAQRWRVVGNDISCPNGFGASACAHGDTSQFIKFFGNNVHDAGTNQVGGIAEQKLYHTVYFSTDSNHIEVGWNTIVPNGGGCRALQFHSSPIGAGTGFNQFDLSVHDNFIHDSRCDGINFATVDPGMGKVEAFNNVVYRAGLGPDPGVSSNYSCIAVLGLTNAGPVPSLASTVNLTNNTLFDCGARQNPDSGGLTVATNGLIKVTMNNNIVDVLTGETYFTPNSRAAGNVTGSNNLFFGAGAGPAFLAANVNLDPRFVNVPADFTPLAPEANAPVVIGARLGAFVPPPPPAPPALQITTASLPTAQVGIPYSTKLAATGGVVPYSWSLSSVLPAGLLFAGDGTLSGTPTSAGTFPLNVQVADSQAPPKTATAALSLVVNAPPNPAPGDFSLSASPNSQTVSLGDSTSYILSITPSGSFTGAVTLGVSGLPAGATASFSPNPATGNSSLTVSTDEGTTPQGSYVLTITGVSGGLTRTTSVVLVVTN